ncbi:MAG: PASTA domain-containing protein, partial [Jiangellaceae bacterium]|nr:PASTA domain-containing protein [Jiangellaceae bacterium]
MSTSFVVPESASLGLHQVVARCVVGDQIVASADFLVTAPVEVLVVVPDLVGESVEDAEDRLVEAELELGDVTGDGNEVQEQDPVAGAEVRRGAPVNVFVGTAQPEVVVVPNLVDSAVADA